MKLIDLLVKELPKRGGWPIKVTSIGQDYDRELMFYGRGKPRTGIILDELAVDHRKCGYQDKGVPRDKYEAALAKNDGWIEWGGGECPVEHGTLVDVRFRDGDDDRNIEANHLLWNHEKWSADIIAYRLHRDTNTRADDDRLEQDLNECIGQDIDVVNHPSHYTKGRIECIDAIDSATTGKSGIEAVCVANIIKYLYRYEEKNGLEDVKKAKWYINKLISELESK